MQHTSSWQDVVGVWHHCHCRQAADRRILLLQQTGTHRSDPTNIKDTAMALVFLVFIVLLTVASAAGLTADSRDGSDWAPTLDGTRVARKL
jgi:hypothetical protein